ncbi:MAG: BMP family ABC transporter substrate-binding protein [Piscinibacter sp.]|nr:BMP family ABC transporter substrate-binding protein [Piscinibacter sp.]
MSKKTLITPAPDALRRHLLAGSALAAGSLLLPGALRRAGAQAPLVVGVIYVGPRGDFGYNQAQAQAAAAIKKLPGVKVVEEENVPETTAVQKTMEAMINQDGASLIFPTSFGYFDPHMLKMAAKYPKVRFAHCGGLWTEGKHPKNTGSYFGYIDECQFLAGVVAGYTSKTKKLGFIAAKPIPQVLRNINAFTLGARMVDPAFTTRVIFTGEWSMPVKEAEASTSLIDQGVDVLTCHVDSPKVIVETAEKRGIFASGYHASQAALAPKGYLTGAEWDWATPYNAQIKAAQSGAPMPNFLRGGLKDGYVKMSPYGAAVGAPAKAKADEIKAAMMKGGYVIFKAGIKDNKGSVVVAKNLDQFDPELEKMNYLVEGVVGAIPG